MNFINKNHRVFLHYVLPSLFGFKIRLPDILQVLVVVLFAGTANANNNWDQVYQKSVPSIPVIFSGGAVCSGALIQKDMVLTAAHCVDRFREIFVYFPKENLKPLKASIQIFDRDTDVALIKLDRTVTAEPLPLLPEENKISEGQAAVTIGHPVARSNFKAISMLRSEYIHVISSGVISRVSHSGFVSDMSVSPGNSGGPVFNSKGEIVGIVSKKRIDRFVGDLGYFASHLQVHQLMRKYKDLGPQRYGVAHASSSVDVYLLYATPTYRKDNEGKSKSYWNIGFAADIWDRLRIFIDTNLDTKEAFTQYGLGWSFYIQGADPAQYYRVIPSVENLKFRYRDPLAPDDEIEKNSLGAAITLKASWFPFYLKASTFNIDKKNYSMVGIGIGF